MVWKGLGKRTDPRGCSSIAGIQTLMHGADEEGEVEQNEQEGWGTRPGKVDGAKYHCA